MAIATQLSTRPLYLQLRDMLAQRIAGGAWRPGAAIPNEGDLAREFGVSSGTMRKALDLLEAERLLTRRQGRSTFINDPASEELATRFDGVRGPDGARAGGEVVALDITDGPASEREAQRLRLAREERVYRMRRQRSLKGKAYMIEAACVPAALFPDLPEKKPASWGLVALARHCGVLLGKAEERITLGQAGPDAAPALGVAPSAPVLILDRVVLTLDGRPAEWRVGHCHLRDAFYLAEMS
jgi:GntR family transcriptional regulator